MVSSHHVSQVGHELLGVAETALADIEALSLSADEVFGVERRIPWLDLDVAQDDIQDIGLGGCLFGRLLLMRHCSGHVVT